MENTTTTEIKAARAAGFSTLADYRNSLAPPATAELTEWEAYRASGFSTLEEYRLDKARRAEKAARRPKQDVLAESRASGLEQALIRGVVAAHRLDWLTQRLIELSGLLLANQPKAHGTVALELHQCGRDCLGCPHPRWVQYTWPQTPQQVAAAKEARDAENADVPAHAKNTTPLRFKQTGDARMLTVNLSTKKQDPAQKLLKTENRPYLLGLVAEVKAVIKERAELIETFSGMRRFTDRVDVPAYNAVVQHLIDSGRVSADEA